MIVAEQLNWFKYWVQERQSIHLKKANNLPKPWTQDPILRDFKFCNVRREDDRVTEWFATNWRHPRYWDHPNFVPAIILGRTINWPYTLTQLGFPEVWDPDKYKAIMDKIQAGGGKVYTGAYMITAGPTGVSKNEWVLGNAESYFKKPPKLIPKSIKRSWETIINNKYPCVGPFIAGQVIADLKQTSVLNEADDWWDWAALGPGSARGLNRMYGRKLTNPIRQVDAVKEMQDIRLAAGLPDLCLQDIQNCLCEFDKYQRVRMGQGKPRSSYPGRK